MDKACAREQIAAADNHEKRDARVSNFYRYGALLPDPSGRQSSAKSTNMEQQISKTIDIDKWYIMSVVYST